MVKNNRNDKLAAGPSTTGSLGISGTAGSDGLKGTESLFPYYDEKGDEKDNKEDKK